MKDRKDSAKASKPLDAEGKRPCTHGSEGRRDGRQAGGGEGELLAVGCYRGGRGPVRVERGRDGEACGLPRTQGYLDDLPDIVLDVDGTLLEAVACELDGVDGSCDGALDACEKWEEVAV